MNKAMFIGNLTRDPESKSTSNGKLRTTFTLAVNRRGRNDSGEREADYIFFTAYDKTAELIDKYLSKGKKAGVECHVRTGSYEKDGRTIYTTDFIVDSIEFLSPAASSPTDDHQAPQTQQPTQTPPRYVTVEDEELPF